jgi:alcohol dehydrogenase, propanol-preferring
MSDIPSFPYRLLWEERQVISIANLTRQDGIEFMQVIAEHPVHTQVKIYSLEEANQALADLRAGAFEGAAVLIP